MARRHHIDDCLTPSHQVSGQGLQPNVSKKPKPNRRAPWTGEEENKPIIAARKLARSKRSGQELFGEGDAHRRNRGLKPVHSAQNVWCDSASRALHTAAHAQSSITPFGIVPFSIDVHET